MWQMLDDHVLNLEGPNKWSLQSISLFAGGAIWFIIFTISYWICEQLSFRFFPKYSKFRQIEKTDWTSRIVATLMILLSIYFSLKVKLLGDESALERRIAHDALSTVNSTYENTDFILHKTRNNDIMFYLYHAYSILLGYEIYDLKNCINLKMTSGVIHHAVLIVMFPVGWSATALSVPSLYMTTFSYCSNLPAHLRSFMLHTGFRETKLYNYNKWAWWVAYIVFRLFGIPWFSAQIYFCVPALKYQTPIFTILWYFSAMVVHYMLSLYWFVNMSRTMFPPKDYDLKRVESFGALPKDDTSASGSLTRSDGGNNNVVVGVGGKKGGNEGGQKFD